MMASDLFQTSLYRFKCFRSGWPSTSLIDWKQIERQFLALSPDEQGHCSQFAARYLSFCQRTGSPVVSPVQWIEARGWAGFLEAERPAAHRFDAKRTPVWIVEGTPAWMAWQRYRENKGQRMPSTEIIRSERGSGWWFPEAFPQTAKARHPGQVRSGS